MANQENIPDRGHYRTEARVEALGWSRYGKGVDRARDRVEGGVSSDTGPSGSALEIQPVLSQLLQPHSFVFRPASASSWIWQYSGLPTPGGAQGLLLAHCLGVASGGVYEGPCWNKPRVLHAAPALLSFELTPCPAALPHSGFLNCLS